MQIDMDVSGRVLRTRMPDRRSGSKFNGSRFNVRSSNPERETRNSEASPPA
jgi:hypothetical protein